MQLVIVAPAGEVTVSASVTEPAIAPVSVSVQTVCPPAAGLTGAQLLPGAVVQAAKFSDRSAIAPGSAPSSIDPPL